MYLNHKKNNIFLADPFLTGNTYKSEPSLTNFNNYTTEYEKNFPLRPFSPRIGPLRRPTNIKLNLGVMDIFSESKSQYKPYSEAVISQARPKAIRKPNNLFLTGEIELFPEYRASYVPYSLDSIHKCNKPTCYHSKRENKLKKTAPEKKIPVKEPSPPPIMSDRNKPLQAKILNNNYGVSCSNRYHQKLESENNNYLPEYRSKFQPVVGKRSSLIPQTSHFRKDDEDLFKGTSEYTNRYKGYDHFTKSAPIKKQDNLHMIGSNDMRPEYTERYKKIDMNSFERRQPYRQQNNLHSEGDFGREMPEYHEKYRSHNADAFPERAKPRQDFLSLNGVMDYSPEYRNNYVEFPRQRPIIKKPPTNIRMPSTHERDRKIDNIDLPINLSYHETGSSRPMRKMGSQDSDELSLESRPEYRRAMQNYLIKERSPSRASNQEQHIQNQKTDKKVTVTDPNDVSKILMENKVNLPEEKVFDEKNEVIIDPIPKPTNFKIPTRSPTRHPSGKGPSYPVQKDHRYKENEAKRNSGRQNLRVTIDDYDHQHHQHQESFSFDEEEPPSMQQVPSHYQRKKSPKHGRRAANPVEEYQIRTKTNVIEANPRYVRERRNDIQPNRHEQNAFCNQHRIPMAQPPADSLANNYRPNYEIDKQHNYRESLRDDKTPFVVIDQQMKPKPNSWMKKNWYDTQ